MGRRQSTWRTAVFEIKESGLYEIATGFADPHIPVWFGAWVDGKPLLYIQGARQLAPGVDPERQLDFLRRAVAVRRLESGKHTLTIHRNDGHTWVDSMNESGLPNDNLMARMRIGVTSLQPGDMETAAIHAVDQAGADRPDMILRLGEPLLVKIEKQGSVGERFVLEVREQRGAEAPVWSGEGTLAKKGREVAATIGYPCPREGAFEYTLKDAAGNTINGPWAFVVVDPTPAAMPKGGAAGDLRKELVDSVDCTLPDDREHKFRDNDTSKVVDSPVGRYRVTGGKGVWNQERHQLIRDAETKTLRPAREGEKAAGGHMTAPDWFAYTLQVKNPKKAHLVVATIPNDRKRLVSVEAIDQASGMQNGAVLAAGDAELSGPFATLSFLVWPNGKALDIVTFNHVGNHGSALNREGAVAKLELYEFPDGLPPLAEPAGGWAKNREFSANCEQLSIWMFGNTMASLAEGDKGFPRGVKAEVTSPLYHDWRGLRDSAERFAQLCRFRGDNLAMVPASTYTESIIPNITLLPKGRDIFSIGPNGKLVDPFDRDIFKMLLLVGQKYDLRLVADLLVQRQMDGAMRSLRHFARESGVEVSDERFVADLKAMMAGAGNYAELSKETVELFVTDLKGTIYLSPTGPILNPANPASRRYFVALLREFGEQYGKFPAFAGVRLRWWPGWGNGCNPFFCSDDNGYDDLTVARFEKETGITVDVPKTGDDRFKLRRDRLLKDDLKDKWLDWRCQTVESLLEEGAAELRRHAPGARLYSGAFQRWPHAPKRGSGIDYDRLAGRKELGFEKWEELGNGMNFTENVEVNDFDPLGFAKLDVRDPSTGRVDLESFVPGKDTAYMGNVCRSFAAIAYPRQLEGMAKALADDQPLDRIVCGEAWGISPVDEKLRAFVRVFRAIPDLKYERFSGSGSDQQMVACWSGSRRRAGFLGFFGGRETVFYLVNRTPEKREVELSLAKGADRLDDLIGGGKLVAKDGSVGVSLEPFMPALFAVNGGDAIAGLKVKVRPEESERIGRQVEFMREINTAAKGVKHFFVGAGEAGASAVKECYRRDAVETFADSFDPINAAWQSGDHSKAALLIGRLATERRWWLEAFGWPEGIDRFDVCASNPSHLVAHNLKPEGAVETRRIEPYGEEFVLIPSGTTIFKGASDARRCELRVRGLFGGGYGPIEVKYCGRTLGVMGTAYAGTRHVRHLLPEPIILPGGPYEITLVGKGAKGLAISSMDLLPLPPGPIRKWSAIGLFDFDSADGESYTDAKRAACWARSSFPPEKEINLGAEYPGMRGKVVRWRQIDAGLDKHVKLLEIYPYEHRKNAAPGSGAAYLAAWINNPAPHKRDVILYYSMDWFGKVWVNDEPVLEISGPWNSFAEKAITLRPGWNKLLVKTATGMCGWNAAFAISDTGDLEYSSTPPK